jgi:hypothetical protein
MHDDLVPVDDGIVAQFRELEALRAFPARFLETCRETVGGAAAIGELVGRLWPAAEIGRAETSGKAAKRGEHKESFHETAIEALGAGRHAAL